MTAERIRRTRRALLRWYDAAKRDLPWRRVRDPYRIWLSEVMLQQTRIAAALPYYERFVARFPRVEHLAAAAPDEVLGLWAGLGYYSRARNLHAAAKMVAQSGAFPATYEAIRELPGIGDYTAAAIGSIAFGIARPAIDGNALRVLSRLTAEQGNIAANATRERLTKFADALLDRKRPGDFNQCVMELGATVCLPRAPRCGACPAAGDCEAYQRGLQCDLPVKPRKLKPERVFATLLYIERGGAVLLRRQSAESKRLPGFWELPGAAQLNGFEARDEIGEFQHTIVGTTYCYRLVSGRVRRRPRGFAWVERAKFHEIPLSTTAKKAMQCLEKYWAKNRAKSRAK